MLGMAVVFGVSVRLPGETRRFEGESVQETVYLNSFSTLTPTDAVSREGEPGKWYLGTFGGRDVLYADGSSQLPAVVLRAGLAGFHDIYVGLYTPGSPIDDCEWQGVHVKLTGDPWYTQICGGRRGLGQGRENGCLDEVFWRRADLTDQAVHIYQPYGRFYKPAAGIAYFRMVPRSAKQMDVDQQQRRQRLLSGGRRHVGGMADFWSWVMVTKKTTETGTREVIDNHKAAGCDTIYFQINGDAQVQYHSKVAQWVSHKANKEPRTAMGQAAEAILHDHDPLRVASRRAKEIGLQFFAWFRVTNEHSILNDDMDYCRRFRHLRTIGADGKPTRWPSLAHGAIRDYKLAILEEVVTSYTVDGLLIDFLRTMPVIGYDEPVVSAYVAKHGVNPLEKVSERSNPRWKQFRADYVTRFMRDLKRIVEQRKGRSGRDIKIAARVTPRDNLWKGLDVERWVEDGLIDVLIPSAYTFFDPVVVVAPFLQMVKGTPCRVYVGINPFFPGGTDDSEHHPSRDEKEVAEIIIRRVRQGCPSPLEYARRALDFYEQGAHGVVLYESETLTSPTRYYPSRTGIIPMVQTLSDPARLVRHRAFLEEQALATAQPKNAAVESGAQDTSPSEVRDSRTRSDEDR